MARTFLFFYVYTVPFALLSDSSNAVAHCIVIFILTYGFMGLEYVSIELDNPFGEDDNVSYVPIYLCVHFLYNAIYLSLVCYI